MKLLFLEPFFGGSHRDFAKGLVAHSAHDIDLVTLPARFWKWRMRGAALHFSEMVRDPDAYSGLITSGLMSLSDFRTVAGPCCPPALVYFHENQITYPVAPGEQRDVHFGFTDITTALAARRILFNSRTHMDDFFAALADFLRQMPEYRPFWVVDAIRAKSAVLYPGCRFANLQAHRPEPSVKTGTPPLIVWNHRWEFDKNPSAFFDALGAVQQEGIDFRLALLGENFQAVPKAFIEARARFGDRIVQYGYVKTKAAYRRWLDTGHIVVSTAIQENFGIAVVEAIRCGCFPLLPNRLSYPEIIPEKFHSACLYDRQEDLVRKLIRALTRPRETRPAARALSAAMARFSWENLIGRYDRELAKLAEPA